jgi:hypothetical protein
LSVSRAKVIKKVETDKFVTILSSAPEVTYRLFASQFVEVRAAGGVVEDEEESVLMIRLRDRWDLPKGHIEKGEISRVPSHKQDSYYPAWIKEDSYTLSGTRLKARNYDKSGNGTMWINPSYDWGYADNNSPIDQLTDEENTEAKAVPNHFRISDAIDLKGKKVELKHIDFIKVQTGVNAQSGWLGELSTEVFSFYDCNMIE